MKKKKSVPRVVLFVEGGVVHDIMSDQRVNVAVIDYDVEGSDNPQTITLPGSEEGRREMCHIGIYKPSKDNRMCVGKKGIDAFWKQFK